MSASPSGSCAPTRPTGEELGAARRFVAELLVTASAPDQPAFGSAATLVGLAGTVAALAAIDQGLDTYDRDRVHHYLLTRDAGRTAAGEPRRASPPPPAGAGREWSPTGPT